ncbi:hypothetical protein Q31b_38090 [Novipirellula aureliae]|uniref:Uncharacterized protein n=1 Tax=Novipirellula aureliae TaxID=2527966 RepID=A0A5C6DTA0_9BACT|nr:hypothetical protein Q31b_38090 [Novipirellula aureliae]
MGQRALQLQRLTRKLPQSPTDEPRTIYQLLTESTHVNRKVHWDVANDLAIVPMDRPPIMDAVIETAERLGGLLRSYRRVASGMLRYQR